ncbi:S1 RNA-binding domain-containing protein [Patescibacteria group bacterium]|nr:S1 RNA-binding domain-containing protein [Patescibacteria group bacterium]
MTKSATLVSMDQLLEDSPELIVPEPGQLVEGTVITVEKNCVMVDIDGLQTGIIAGRETRDASETIKNLEPGDNITACVLESENDEGLVVLSLRRASQEKTWKKFINAYEKNESFKVRPKEANKGGLLLEIDGIKGFIPVSQLAPLHYPRVNGADSAKILARLQKLVGTEFTVKIISIDKENGKLILSEKAAYSDQRHATLGDLKVGDVVEGTISGIVKFGIFVAFDGLEGLVHISEIAWGHVTNPNDFGKLGDKMKVKVIGIEGDKISLSVKQLSEDPWEKIAKNYKLNAMVKAKITRLAPFGAFVELSDDINGLIHSSEIPGNPADPSDVLKVGQTVEAKVIEVNQDERRIGLSLLSEDEAKVKNESSQEPELENDAPSE